MNFGVRAISSHGFDEIIITTHYCSDRIRDHFGDGNTFGVHVRYAHEKQLMNTAGSLKLLEDSLYDDFLVIGGNDYLPELDLAELVNHHTSCGGIGTIVFKN